MIWFVRLSLIMHNLFIPELAFLLFKTNQHYSNTHVRLTTKILLGPLHTLIGNQAVCC